MALHKRGFEGLHELMYSHNDEVGRTGTLVSQTTVMSAHVILAGNCGEEIAAGNLSGLRYATPCTGFVRYTYMTVQKASCTNQNRDSADPESTDQLDKFACDNAHKASDDFRTSEGGIEARVIMFYENTDRQRLEFDAVGREVSNVTKVGAI